MRNPPVPLDSIPTAQKVQTSHVSTTEITKLPTLNDPAYRRIWRALRQGNAMHHFLGRLGDSGFSRRRRSR